MPTGILEVIFILKDTYITSSLAYGTARTEIGQTENALESLSSTMMNGHYFKLCNERCYSDVIFLRIFLSECFCILDCVQSVVWYLMDILNTTYDLKKDCLQFLSIDCYLMAYIVITVKLIYYLNGVQE